MFLTGVLVGSIIGTTVCVAAAVVHLLAVEAEVAAAGQPALVPLHVTGSLVSLN